MIFYMTEVVVGDFNAALRWFRDVLILPVELLDERRQFALIGTSQGRIGLTGCKPGAAPNLPRLTLLVEDLVETRSRLVETRPTEIVEDHVERFRSFRLEGPEGLQITVFEWSSSDNHT